MAATHRDQFNLELPPEVATIARQIATAKKVSIPQLLRPVIVEWLEQQMTNPLVRNAVESSLQLQAHFEAEAVGENPDQPPSDEDSHDPLEAADSGSLDTAAEGQANVRPLRRTRRAPKSD